MTEEQIKQKFKETYPDFMRGDEPLSPYFDIWEYGIEIATKELEEKISVLLSCKNCPENKGGLICQKEYENKCLSQKIQFIKELQEENKVLNEQKQLTKAKELLNMFLRLHYNPIVDEHTLFCKVEQFLNSEVEK